MEENMLKVKYNELLARYNKGAEYLAKNPEDDKALEEFNRISDELNNIIQAIPNMTDKEKTEGFVIEESEKVSEQVEEQPIIVKAGERELYTGKTENMNYVVPAPVEQSKSQVIISNGRANGKQNALSTFKDNWEIATQLAQSDIIPDNYKKKPANVVIAIGIANQMNLDPFIVMQNLSFIKGKTSWSGSFCRTLIERTGKFKDLELNYIGEKDQDSYGCYLSATRVSDGKKINGPKVTIAMAKAEKWTSNPKWSTLKDLMLAYRCQSYFCRIHCPEAMSGIYTTEEIEDINTTREQPKDILA